MIAMTIEEVIKRYEERLKTLGADVDELNEMLDDDFNPSDRSGGNSDDAYSMGDRHGRLLEEYSLLQTVVSDLKAIRKEATE